jgi:hypothetical protein
MLIISAAMGPAPIIIGQMQCVGESNSYVRHSKHSKHTSCSSRPPAGSDKGGWVVGGRGDGGKRPRHRASGKNVLQEPRHKRAVVKYVCTGDYSIRISSPVTSLIVRAGLIYQVQTLCRYKDAFVTRRFSNITLHPLFFPSLPCTAVVPQATVSSTSFLSRL